MSRCNKCGCDPCGGGCKPARYSCDFSIQVDPYDPYVWLFDNCGKINRIRIPRFKETDTYLRVDHGSSSLIYDAEYHRDVIDGCDLGSIINLDCLRDVEAPDPDSCDLLIFDPGCSPCGDGCKPRPAMWRNYHIPDAEDCIVPLDDDGYYKVLVKDECGCPVECRLPAKPDDEDKIIYLRDSTPEDPDYPWYYGIYNETINLYLAQNVPKWFGKYDLEITVNYDVQVILSNKCENTNYRSLVVPCVEGQRGDAAYDSSILQGQSTWEDIIPPMRGTPWGTVSQRSSITFVVPKGKEAYLHHEFRLRNGPDFPRYVENPLDGQRVPDEIASQYNKIQWTASRLHSLQCIIKPTSGGIDKDPVRDEIRNQLDHWEDWYPNI